MGEHPSHGHCFPHEEGAFDLHVRWAVAGNAPHHPRLMRRSSPERRLPPSIQAKRCNQAPRRNLWRELQRTIPVYIPAYLGQAARLPSIPIEARSGSGCSRRPLQQERGARPKEDAANASNRLLDEQPREKPCSSRFGMDTFHWASHSSYPQTASDL
jgi:hypothetical protein